MTDGRFQTSIEWEPKFQAPPQLIIPHRAPSSSRISQAISPLLTQQHSHSSHRRLSRNNCLDLRPCPSRCCLYEEQARDATIPPFTAQIDQLPTWTRPSPYIIRFDLAERRHLVLTPDPVLVAHTRSRPGPPRMRRYQATALESAHYAVLVSRAETSRPIFIDLVDK